MPRSGKSLPKSNDTAGLKHLENIVIQHQSIINLFLKETPYLVCIEYMVTNIFMVNNTLI